MGFGFSEEEEKFRTKVRDFVQQELNPRAKEIAKSNIFPRDLWRRMGEFGLLGVGLPEKYGGSRGNCIMRGIVAEEIGKADLSLAFTLISSYGTSIVLLHGGSKELQDKWIPGFIKGDKLGSISMTEPDCGSDLSLVRTKARREDDYYVLNGEKNYVSWGLEAEANWAFVKTDSDVNPWDLTALFLPLNLSGIVKSSFLETGLHAVGHTSLSLENVRVPFEYLLGEEGKALRLAAKTFPHTRMILSLSALGLAEVSLEEAINFAKQRSAFGKPIGKFEGVSFKIAEDATLIESTRWLCYRTLWLMDQEIRCVKEIAMCKWWSTEVAFRTIYDALLLHGHSGYSSEYLLEQRLRDIIGYEIAEAAPQIVKLDICEQILGKGLRPFC